MQILVVGSLNMDLVVSVERHPQVGETLLGNSFQTFPGGKGANQAVAARRLGGQVAMLGRVGRDAFGASLRQSLETDGVSTGWLLSDEAAPTGVALITVSAGGANTIVVVPGANGRLSSADLAAAQPAFQKAQVVLLQLEIPIPTVLEAARLGKQQGAKILLNPAPAALLPDELFGLVDVLIPNEHELLLLAGEAADPEQAIRVLLGKGAASILVTLGSRGALLANGGERVHLPAYPVQAVDTVAAGDAFIGALAVALAEGRPLLEAARWGNAAGAVAVTRAGAQPSLPYRGELEQMLGGS